MLSHACGVGPLLDDAVVRLLLVLKIASLSKGASGIRRETLEALVAMVNGGVSPCIPSKGSVGASGDLAPLAHMSCVLIGVGEARVNGETMPAEAALATVGLKPIVLGPKEGLALLNALLNTASGASWVSLHHGGGVGMGYSQHSGVVIVADGTPEAAKRLERVLWNDPATGVMRHADAGYEIAKDAARANGLNLPSLEA